MEGRRIVSEAWIDEITSWGESDGQVRHGTPPLPGGSALNDLSDFGYKSYIWCASLDCIRAAQVSLAVRAGT